MKYCKRCFRNIEDKYKACPHCNQSDKLIDYSSSDSGEKFECEEETHKIRDTYKKENCYQIEANNPYDNYIEENNKEKESTEAISLVVENMTSAQKQEYIHNKIEERKKQLNMPASTIQINNNQRGTVTSALDTFPEEKKTLIMPLWGKVLYALFTFGNPIVAIFGFIVLNKIFKDDLATKTLGIFMIILSLIITFGGAIAGSLLA